MVVGCSFKFVKANRGEEKIREERRREKKMAKTVRLPPSTYARPAELMNSTDRGRQDHVTTRPNLHVLY